MKGNFTVLLLVVVATWLAALGARAQVLPGTFAAGATHSLAIHADGTLWATGANATGQLGTGTTTSQTTWVQVGSLATWVRVAAGARHSLALRADGSLWAWGDNTAGQLGTATSSGTGYVATPTQVPGTYTQLAAGRAHSLALQANGTLWAWGDNFYGQLGNATNTGTTNPNPTPTQISSASYTQLAAGADFGLALRQDGSLWAWGRNTYGQLGSATNNGTDTATPTPTRVGTDLYTQLAAGAQHSLALRPDGTLWAWGDNFFGQLGNATGTGTNTANPTPTQVGTASFTRLGAGTGHSLALQATGTLYAWGDNAAGQLGTSGGAASATPTAVPGTYVQLAAGTSHSLALQANGTLWAWGDNAAGQLGGGGTSAAAPVATGSALPTRSTAMGSGHGLAVRADGTLWAWGDNTFGQLGDGTTTFRTRPVQVGTDNDWVQVAGGTSFSLALKANGTLWAWGSNNLGQLGNSTNSGMTNANTTPLQVGGGNYTRIAAGPSHALAIRDDGVLYSWGSNFYGQLGNGTSSVNSATASPTPAPVSGSGIYTQIAAGLYHSMALRADGSLWTWGNNDQGQLGTNQFLGGGNLVKSPTVAPGTYTAIAAGSSHSLALSSDGLLYTWGLNNNGQLGNQPRSVFNTYQASPLADIYSQLAAGANHSLALRANGSLWVWGRNANGQLGLNTTAQADVPTQEFTQATMWTALATGSAANFSLVRVPSGLTFSSAGQNSAGQNSAGQTIGGQLGDGTTTDYRRFDRLLPLNQQPLPVVLTAFEARRTAATTVALEWATASELHNAGFGVERSVDGHTFGRIGFVAAQSQNSSTALAYTFQDKTATGPAYYRLAQTDIDGSVTFSPVRYVGSFEGAVATLQLVPNPAAGGLVQAQGLAEGAMLAVYDVAGRLVRPAAATLDVTGLTPGVYVVRAWAPGQPAQSARLLVQ